jgi:uncharacterized membrane protein YjgN (DUF898 family)
MQSSYGTTTQAPLPAPQEINSYAFEFSATGSEYFRIWIVNVLLILLTFGFYAPWAKVRKLKYFYSNTRVDGHAFDFHGNPWKILRGMVIVAVFLIAYSQAAEFAPIAGAIALLALLVLAPILFRSAMQFRLANSSWRGMRFRFMDKNSKEPFWCIVPALMLILLPGTVLAFFGDPDKDSLSVGQTAMTAVATVVGVFTLVWLVLMPYFFWRIKRYQHNHYAWGPLQSQYRSGVADTYKVVGVTALVALGIAVVFGGLALALVPAAILGNRSGFAGPAATIALFPLLLAFVVCINIAPRAFFKARMQNLLWSRTGNNYFRFKSDVRPRHYMLLQFKNYFLIMFTLGLYWPFAVVATQRMLLEAMSLKTRVDLGALSDSAREHENDAAGDMAADFFGLDVGM